MGRTRIYLLVCCFSLIAFVSSASQLTAEGSITAGIAQQDLEDLLNSCDTSWIVGGVPMMSPLNGALLAALLAGIAVLLLRRRWKLASLVLVISIVFVILVVTQLLPTAHLSSALAEYPPPECEDYTRVNPLQEFTPEQKQQIREAIQAAYPGIILEVVYPTRMYNCHTYALYGEGKDIWVHCDKVEKLMGNEGYTKRGAEGTVAAEVGDIIVYRTVAGGTPTHTAKVLQVDGGGNIVKVRSKWGQAGLYDHAVDYVPASYGTVREVWRK